MKKVLFKNSVKQIMKTHKRFISILLMAFLGVGFFAGVRATSPDMKKTVDSYFDSTNMYDISIVSTLGLTDEDINAVSKVEGVDKAYGLYSEDVFVSLNGEESIVKLYAYDENINKLEIIDGKLPENVDECVIEVSMKDSESISIGDYIDIRENLGEDEDTSFKNTKLKVVGIVRSPLYISRDRGTTTLGSGKINYYMFVNKENIISDVYTEIDVLVNDAKNLDAISDKYEELIDKTINNIESIKEERQTARYNELVNEANQKLDDDQKELDIEKQNDGTVAPCGSAGSIVFTPELSIKALEYFYNKVPKLWGKYGFKDGYNLEGTKPWFAKEYIGIDKGIEVLMIENYLNGTIWKYFMNNKYIKKRFKRHRFYK